ncbi:hypothetical protein N665_0511s0023 [Sinapis alba]|nr:hypothetical protein N665_0511s0023 [Sinapis alba]
MVIAMKTLVMFVFTTFFIISFVDYRTTTAATIPDNSPCYGINMGTIVCFNLTKSCYSGGREECQKLCEERGYYFKKCSQDQCYCEK